MVGGYYNTDETFCLCLQCRRQNYSHMLQCTISGGKKKGEWERLFYCGQDAFDYDAGQVFFIAKTVKYNLLSPSTLVCQ
jgi:hypothetical protein